jgi:pimeloyl-ACP methyl ester carboxylesterase
VRITLSDALARQMPPPSYVDTNGIRMACYEAGPRQGLPIILCHGFPELAFSWRHQLRALSAAGRWTIAPDQRGYGLTSAPKAIDDYDLDHLAGDLVGLLDALGVEKAIFCGHDWGGSVVWHVAQRHPDRVAGVIALNTPFLPRQPEHPIATLRTTYGDDMYIVWFMQPGAADAAFAADPERTIRFFMRKPPVTLADYLRRPAERRTLALGEMLKRYDPAADRRQFLSDAEIAAFAETFAATGFTGGINWYRNISRNWERSADLPDRIEVPALMILAENDIALSPSLADGMERRVPDLRKYLVRGSGHWTQQEAPEEVSRVMLDWLDERLWASKDAIAAPGRS